MPRPGRPVSESYQPVCRSVSQSSSYSTDDQAPIFSLSKSSMDVVMATGPAHKRDPAWTRVDLRRSSSTNTHAERNSVTLQQLHPHMWQHINPTGGSVGHQPSVSAPHADTLGPPALSERWIANMHRWSACSSGGGSSTHSRSSTPDTVVWKGGGASRPSSFTQETPCSPRCKPSSSPTTPSSFISPLQTPTLPQEDPFTSSRSALTLSTHEQEDLLTKPSPPTPPMQAHTFSPLPSYSPNLPQLPGTEDEGFLNEPLCFVFPSPIASSVSLAEGGASSDAGCFVDDVIEKLHSPGGSEESESEAVRSPARILNDFTPTSPAEEQETGSGASVRHLELPWQPWPSFPIGREWKSPLVSSLSDSLLGDCCRCNLNAREALTRAQGFREEGTMTSQVDLVDAAVQTISPVNSMWGLRRNLSNSNMGSHSLLGSPPGSRLNLKCLVGSNSNLVSPSSSMFPMSSCELEVRRDDDPTWEINSASSRDLERKRSCLKMKDGEVDANGRRGSMKQVQWDEDGMTWDVHGATLDPAVLSTAILKHLELQSSPQTPTRTSKKKKAPKPPLISNVVKAIVPDLHPPVMIITSACTEGESGGRPEEDGACREVVEEGRGKKEEAVRRISRAEAAYAKEEDEVYRDEGIIHPKSPSSGSGHSRKRSVIRALKKPRWCGGFSKADD